MVKEVWDGSLSFTSGTYEYTVPATVTTVRDLYYQRTSTDPKEKISPGLYDVVAGTIRFLEYTQDWLDDNYTLYIKGWYKLSSSDSLTTTNLVNYVLWHAAEILLSNLMFKKAFYFLKTDTTMADVARALQIAQGNTLRYKQGLLRTFESA